MSDNPHFASPATWDDAAGWLTFTPRQPSYTAGESLRALRVFIRDHREQLVPVGGRSLEAHYGSFVVTQERSSTRDARERALDVSYGSTPQIIHVAASEGRAYAAGPDPGPDDPDGPMSAVVVWSDDDRLYLIASTERPVEELLRVAESLY